MKMQAAVELYLTTQQQQYLDFILDHQEMAIKGINRSGWYMARLVKQMETMKDSRAKKFATAFCAALPAGEQAGTSRVSVSSIIS